MNLYVCVVSFQNILHVYGIYSFIFTSTKNGSLHLLRKLIVIYRYRYIETDRTELYTIQF